MNGTRTMFRLVLASALGLLPLAAQDYDFKVRMGLNAGTIVKDLRDNKTVGLALQATFPMGASSALTAELGYDYTGGRGRDRVAEKAGAPIWFNQNGTVVNSVNGAPLFIQVAQSNGSFDVVKRGFEGFSLRGGYQQALPLVEGLAWQAGLSLGVLKSDNEFTGNAVPVYRDAKGVVTNLGKDAYEGWVINRERTTVQVGAYAGLVYRLHENHKVEFNVRNVGYGLKDYTPLAYTGRQAELVDVKGRGWVFELGLTVKL